MRRTSLVALVLAAASFAVPGQASAAPAGTCSPTAATFCGDFSAAQYLPGTQTPATTAAAPADLSFGLTNTSSGLGSDESLWWKSIQLTLGQDSLHAPVFSTDLPDGLIVAGTRAASTTCTPANPYNATNCPAGYGSAWVESPTVIIGFPVAPRHVTFGIVNIHAVRSGSDPLRFDATLSIKYPDSTSQTVTVTFGGAVSTDGKPGIVLPMTFNTGGVPNMKGAFDDFHLTWRGTSNETTTGTVAAVTTARLPIECGTSALALSATDAAGDTVSKALPATITGCPTVGSLTAAPGRIARQVQATAVAASDSREVTKYYWAFDDGSTTQTTSPTVTHDFSWDAPHTVTVVAADSAGALSAPKKIELAGTTLAGVQTGLTKLSGKIADATSHAALDGTVRLYRCPTNVTDLAACTAAGTSTATAGDWSFPIPRPSAPVRYIVGSDSTATRVGGLVNILARPQSTITIKAPRSVSRKRYFTVSGQVSNPAQPGQVALIQRLSGKTWKTIAKVRLTGASSYAKKIRIPRGTQYLLVTIPNTAKSLPAYSSIRGVQVR